MSLALNMFGCGTGAQYNFQVVFRGFLSIISRRRVFILGEMRGRLGGHRAASSLLTSRGTYRFLLACLEMQAPKFGCQYLSASAPQFRSLALSTTVNQHRTFTSRTGPPIRASARWQPKFIFVQSTADDHAPQPGRGLLRGIEAKQRLEWVQRALYVRPGTHKSPPARHLGALR
jgi:hypothetical protein